ncbi:hypothetical protein V496_06985 [Pseudogymnoascus sp. VKM F-4515 (FW-2607)]|nr:hypothetical protein V496_06985 [Pseudogymnoascus sp. VKM F-4515 (FW-2607)]KFY91230.1 hypothetical protein V498_05584 [Pseudogymnoascus sp. VKM F-4517 (FW-2822)]
MVDGEFEGEDGCDLREDRIEYAESVEREIEAGQTSTECAVVVAEGIVICDEGAEKRTAATRLEGDDGDEGDEGDEGEGLLTGDDWDEPQQYSSTWQRAL